MGRLDSIFENKSHQKILDGIMPGGRHWSDFIKKGNTCLTSCPKFPLCFDCQVSPPKWKSISSKNGICGKLENKYNWRNSEADAQNLAVIVHVFEKFDFYNLYDTDFNKDSKPVKEILLKAAKLLKKAGKGLNADYYTETERDTIIKQRLVQGEFRSNLMDYWSRSCSVTGCNVEAMLIASHIKPWKDCDGDEVNDRCDTFNGLLLIAGLDALFDKGYITFTEKGKIKISKELSKLHCDILGVSIEMSLRQLDKKHLPYMKYHRENVFRQ